MKRLGLAAVALLGVVAMASGCSSDGGGGHNAADVSFARDMIPHHRQAVEMADMALRQGAAPQVKDLAARIKAAQGPEIARMSGWLKKWGEKVPDASSGMGDMAHGGTGVMGMMSVGEMKQLSVATGNAFDTLFLRMMTTHHRGAVDMAQTELDRGKDADAKALAGSIQRDQRREVDEMSRLLTSP